MDVSEYEIALPDLDNLQQAAAYWGWPPPYQHAGNTAESSPAGAKQGHESVLPLPADSCV